MIKKWIKENPSGIHILVYIIFTLILFLIIAFQSVTIIQIKTDLNNEKEKYFNLQNEMNYLMQKTEKEINEFDIEEKAREMGMKYNNEQIVEIVEFDDYNGKNVTHTEKTIIYIKEWYNFIKKQWDNLF